MVKGGQNPSLKGIFAGFSNLLRRCSAVMGSNYLLAFTLLFSIFESASGLLHKYAGIL
jgi:hypothetical protein